MNANEIKDALRSLLENCAVDQDSDLYKNAAQGLAELDEHYELTDSRYAIAIVWQIDDVLSIRPDLTEEEAGEVLNAVEHGHDATLGVTWYTLELYADEMYPEPDNEESEDGDEVA